jgi:hypothetical protein
MSDEDRQKMTQLQQQLQNASDADKAKIQQQIGDIRQKYGAGRRGPAGQGDNAGAGGFGGPGGPPAGGGGGRQGGGGFGGAMAGAPVFTDDDRANAQLPLPPEASTTSAMQMLLRPGLLADVEVEIEKIPNAIHVPKQAVFLKGGQNVVFVQEADGKFQQHTVQVARLSESMAVISGGVNEGDTVALADPTAQAKETKGGTEEQKGSADAMKGFGGN